MLKSLTGQGSLHTLADRISRKLGIVIQFLKNEQFNVHYDNYAFYLFDNSV